MFDKNEFLKYANKHLGMNKMHVEDYIEKTTPKGAAFPNVTGFTPYVIEERPMHAQALDVFSRLMMDRIIFLGVPIDSYVANVVQAQLLFMDSVDPKRDVQMYVNSPGGSVTAGLGMYDTMQYISPDVATICTGIAASMGAVLLAAGAAGKRTCLQHSRVMIHQPMGGFQGQVTDVEIHAEEMKRLKQGLNESMAKHCGREVREIKADTERDNFMSAKEAKDYGIVDSVVSKRPTPIKNS